MGDVPWIAKADVQAAHNVLSPAGKEIRIEKVILRALIESLIILKMKCFKHFYAVALFLPWYEFREY